MRDIMQKTASSLAIGVLLMVACSTQAWADEQPDKRVYALIVANNTSVDEGVKPLKFADDDGARYFELFESLADDTSLLTTLDADSQKVFPDVAAVSKTPSRENLRQEVSRLKDRLERDAQAGIETELFLVFTGHGNVSEDGEGYLSLRDGKLTRRSLYRDVVAQLDADYTHLFIDACHSYFMVEARGGDWQDDAADEPLNEELTRYLAERGNKVTQNRMSTVGVVVSTSGTAEVHEWSRYRSGVFSHQLRSALLGAADVDGDAALTYDEIEAYLVSANAGVTNPKARINVYAKPPEQHRAKPILALDDYEGATRLRLPTTSSGRYHLEDARGLRYADFHAGLGQATEIVLLRNPVDGRTYYLRTNDQQAAVPTGDTEVESTELAFADAPNQSRGSVEESFRNELFAVPYSTGFHAGFVAGRDKYAGTDVPAGSESDIERAEWELGVGYAVGQTFRSSGPGLQHIGSASAVARWSSGWAFGGFLNYGYSLDTASNAVHRAALGVQGSYEWALGPYLYLMPRMRLGHQVFVVDADTAQGDPLGLRGEAALVVGWRLDNGMALQLEPGTSLDVATFTDNDTLENNEELLVRPYLGVGLRF
jgi:hypothetical protein